MTLRIGLISDTHGLMRPEALAFLRGCAHIVHAGDIGGREILAALENLAPVTAVRGNNDTGAWGAQLPESRTFEACGVLLHVVHDISKLDIDLEREKVRAVISGHSHRPSAQERDGIWFVNPGSAGRRRFTLPISVGEISIDAAAITVRTVELKLRP